MKNVARVDGGGEVVGVGDGGRVEEEGVKEHSICTESGHGCTAAHKALKADSLFYSLSFIHTRRTHTVAVIFYRGKTTIKKRINTFIMLLC